MKLLTFVCFMLLVASAFLPAVDAGPGTLTYYPEAPEVQGTVNCLASGSQGLVVGGTELILPGQVTAGPLVIRRNGAVVVPPLSGTITAVDADAQGNVVALGTRTGTSGSSEQFLVRSTAAGIAFTEIPLPDFRTTPLLDSGRIRLTQGGGFVVTGAFQAQPGISRPTIIACWLPGTGWTALDGLTGTIGDVMVDGSDRITVVGQLSLAGNSRTLVRFESGIWNVVPGAFADDYGTFARTAGGELAFRTTNKLWWPGSGTWSEIPIPNNDSSQSDTLAIMEDGAPIIVIYSHAGPYPNQNYLPLKLYRWDGATWTQVGQLICDDISASRSTIQLVSTPGNGLAIRGPWTTYASNDQVMLWDGAVWNPIGGAAIHPSKSLPGWIETNGDVVIADRNRLLRHDGSAWHLLVAGDWLDFGYVFDRTVKLPGGYAVSYWNNLVDYLPAAEYSLNIWDGHTWSKQPFSSVQDPLVMLTLKNGQLIVGGRFTFSTSEGTAKNIARWDGSQWHCLGGGTEGAVKGMVERADGSVVVAGTFTAVDGDLPMPAIGVWNGTSWARLAASATPGIDNKTFISAVAQDVNGDIVIGLTHFEFSFYSYYTVGVTDTPLAYRWDGNAWSAMGVMSGLGSVKGFAQDAAGGLIASGEFTKADSVAVNGLARWDGNAWQTLGATVVAENPAMTASPGIIGKHWGDFARWSGPQLLMTSLQSNLVEGRNFFLTKDTSPVIFGTGIPGAGFSLLRDGVVLLHGTVDGNGRWTATLPGTWADGFHTVTMQPDVTMAASQTAGFTVENLLPVLTGMDFRYQSGYDHPNEPFVNSVFVTLTFNKDLATPNSFPITDIANHVLTAQRQSARVVVVQVPEPYYPQNGYYIDFLSSLVDRLGNVLPLKVYLNPQGYASLNQTFDDARPLTVERLDYQLADLPDTTPRTWLLITVTLSKTVKTPDFNFHIKDMAGNPVLVYRSGITQYTIRIDPAAYNQVGNRLDFGTTLIDAQGNTINPAVYISRDGVASLAAPPGGSTGTGDTTSGGSSGGGCGVGGSLGLLFGFLAIAQLRRTDRPQRRLHSSTSR